MKRLVIAPHVDDDVLGCSGVLGPETVTFYCGVDDFHVVSAAERRREADAVAGRTGGSYFWPAHDGDTWMNRVNHYEVPVLIPLFERVISAHRTDEVYIPWPSYNQDHQAVYHAALVALRPHDKNHFVPRVFVYEQEHVAIWDHATPGSQFEPNYYVPLDIDRKLELYHLMASQVRGHRPDELIRGLAAARGAAIGVPYAEAFKVLRMVS